VIQNLRWPIRRGRLLSSAATLAATVVMLLPIAGCGGGAGAPTAHPGGSSAPAGAPSAAPPPQVNLDEYYHQKLTWGPCTSFAVSADDREAFADPKYDCTYVSVPLDYSRQDSPTAKIAVLRQKALGPASQRIGSLLMNPGGPGASGTSVVPSVGKQIGNGPIAQRFDLIGFDPRGVGASKPAVQCYTGPERDADRLIYIADTSPAGVAKVEGREKQFDEDCRKRTGGDEVLANLGTRDAARDIDILRAALGDAKLTYLGYSYGTDLGTTYAEQFPNNVRALVLDGAIDPAQGEIEQQIAQAASFQNAFNTFAKWCTGQPDCPLGTDPAPAAVNDAFHKLVWPLMDRPLPLPDGRKLSYPDAVTGTIESLYSTQLWAPLKLGLQELQAGSGQVLMLLADAYYTRQPNGTYTGELDAFTAINCMDERHITNPAVALEESKRVIQVAPFESDGHGPSAALDNCAFWPVPPTSLPHTPHIANLPTVLVISVTGDPATPYQAGVNLAKDLGARLLTVQGTQHTVALQGNACVDTVVTKYLTDLTLPAEGNRCVAEVPH
jgi:pimeloyl-ACP methyl ester carboxylesterase